MKTDWVEAVDMTPGQIDDGCCESELLKSQ